MHREAGHGEAAHGRAEHNPAAHAATAHGVEHNAGHGAAAAHGFEHGAAAHNLAAHNLSGHAFAGRNFAAHGFRHGPGGRGFGGGYWGGYNGYGYGGWAGPVFWPYAFDDMFGYVLSPWDYDDPFWGYGPFDVLAGLYWPYAWAPSDADGLGLPFSSGDVYGSRRGRTHVARAQRASHNGAEPGSPSSADAAAMCADNAANLTGLPIDEIERTVQPTGDQRTDLDGLKAAFDKANQTLAASCPSEPPLTPTGRLAAMEKRLDAMLQAVETVRGPLDKFYQALNDDERARFDAMRVDTGPHIAGKGKRPGFATSIEVCRAQAPEPSAFPEREIEDVVHPNDQQRSALEALRETSLKASELMKSSCPAEAPSTSTGRLAAVRARIEAMLQAVKAERPAMEKFFGSLSDEQKARFDAMRPQESPQRTKHRG
jgi:hypothetical protein